MSLAALAAVGSQADAAVVRNSQDVFAAGDFAFGAYDDNYMPTFDPSLGTLTAVRVHLAGVLEWGEPLIAETESPGPGTYETISSIFIFGNDATWEIDGPTEFHNFTYLIEGVSQQVAIQGSFFDDPSLFQDPSNPEDLVVNPFAAAFCAGNCIEDFSDDSGGFFSGTLRTTFIYTPAFPAPEPSSLMMFLTGAALLGCAARRRAA